MCIRDRHYSIQVHPEKAKSLIYDMEHVKVDSDGSIIKANRNDPTQMSDALEMCIRDRYLALDLTNARQLTQEQQERHGR